MRAGLTIRLGVLERQIDETLRTAARLPDAVRETPRAPSTWSPIQVVQHLVLVHEGAAAVLARAPAPVQDTHPPSWWRPAVLRLVLRAGIRFKAPTRRIIPVEAVSLESLSQRWRGAQATLRTSVATKGRHWHGEGLFRHPLAGWLDLDQTLEFLSDHIEHHLGQVGRS